LSIIDIINDYGKNTPNKLAHIYKESQLTYQDLLNRSNALASYIIDEFGQEKTPIVVYGHKQHEMIISFLACVKAGHAYVPIDSSLPADRIRDIIESSNTRMILSVGELDYDGQEIIIKNQNQINEIFTEYDGRVPDASYHVKDNETYYIIYTSGSTGKPKGVQISINNLESFVSWGLGLTNVNANTQAIFMNQAPFSFDLSVMDLYLSLASGSTLFSVDKKMIENPKLLFEYFDQSNISVWVSTPSFADMCLADSHFNQTLLPNLDVFLFCGEVLSNTTVDKLQERFDNIRIINTYGPTEATVAVTSIEVTPEVNGTNRPLPIGYVKNDCTIKIMSEAGQELPEGEKGEIIIIGDSVSKGYYNNPEMTTKAFFQIESNGKLKNGYKTGDEGYLKDGLLYYSGRMDFQVKVNGYRIELEDIENNLRKIDIIKNGVVLPVKKEGKIQSLAAIVTLNQVIHEKEFKIALMIKNELKKLLPEYMIPRKIIFKDSLPMTPNGKIDRKRLLEEIE